MTLKSKRRSTRAQVRCFTTALAVLLLTSLPAIAQQGTAPAGGATPWTHQDFANHPTEFQFAIVSDRAANPREGVFLAALAKLELLRPEFVLSIGDFIHGYDEQRKPASSIISRGSP
jgi:hypothetical protein